MRSLQSVEEEKCLWKRAKCATLRREECGISARLVFMADTLAVRLWLHRMKRTELFWLSYNERFSLSVRVSQTEHAYSSLGHIRVVQSILQKGG